MKKSVALFAAMAVAVAGAALQTFFKIVRHNGAKFWYNILRQKESNTMSLTLTAEPEIIDGARSYAARSGMTLEAFVLAYLETAARRERRQEVSWRHDDATSQKTPLFGALKDKIKFIAPDFDEPLEDFAEYM